MMKLHKIFFLSIVYLAGISCFYAQTASWQKVSHIDGGVSKALALDSSGNIYNATYGNGLFKSTDKGLSWKKIGNSAISDFINDLYISPQNDLYVFTYNPSLNNKETKYSNDGGNSWHLFTIQNSSSIIQTVAFNSKGTLFAGTNNGLYYSNDNGKTWAQNTLFEGRSIITIAYISGTLFVNNEEGWQKIIFSISKDEGKTWKETSYDNPGFNYTKRTYVDGKTGKCYSFSLYNTTFSAYSSISVTYDGGNTWKSINTQGNIVNDITADSKGNLYAAINYKGILRSTDDSTWISLSNGINNPFINSIMIDKNGNIYAGTNGTVICSNDNGDTWKELSRGLNTSNLKYLIADKKGTLYALASYQGIFRSPDKGENWYMIDNGFYQGYANGIFLANNNLFASEAYSTGRYNKFNASYRFNEAGNIWEKLDIMFTQIVAGSNGIIYALYWDGYNGYSQLYSSSNNGDSWTSLNSTLSYMHPSSIAANPKGAVYLLSESEHKIVKSQDNGLSWNNIKYTEPFGFEIKVNSKNYIFVKADDYRILRTKNDGESWESINNNLPHEKINTVSLDESGKVFLVLDNGQLFYSSNDGDSWNDITYNLLLPGIISATDDNNSRLYVNTKTSEVYYLNLNTLIDGEDNPKDTPEDYNLSQNYPNPFNPTTNITYSIPRSNQVKLVVFDILGKEVATLVNEYKTTGSYTVQFNAANLPSGIYFYRLEAGSFIETKKLILLK